MVQKHNLKRSSEAAQVTKKGEWGHGAGSLGHIFFAYIQIVSRTLVLLKFALATTCLAILEKGVSEKPMMSSFRRFLMGHLLMHMLQTLQLNQPCL